MIVVQSEPELSIRVKGATLRPTCAAAFVVAFLLIAGREVHALTYADGATLDSQYYASVQSLGDSANGTSETDNQRTTITQNGGSVSLVFVTYDFPDYSAGAGTHRVYFVLDTAIKGTISARVTQVNGDSSYAGSATSIVSTRTNDQPVGVDFTIDKALDITSISFLIVLADATRSAKIEIEAVALPEPGTWLLFGVGAAGLCVWGRRRRIRPART